MIICFAHWFFSPQSLCRIYRMMEILKETCRLRLRTEHRSMSIRRKCYCIACQDISRRADDIDPCLNVLYVCECSKEWKKKLWRITNILSSHHLTSSILNHSRSQSSPSACSLSCQPVSSFSLRSYYVKSRQTVAHPMFMSLRPSLSVVLFSH